MNNTKGKKRNNNKGFTLVELIVVIVILAILAAILVPQLLGYIDRAKRSQHILTAKNCMNAMQSKLVEIYAEGKPIGVKTRNRDSGQGAKDVSWRNTSIAKDVLANDIVNTTDGFVKDWNINGEKVTLSVTKVD